MPNVNCYLPAHLNNRRGELPAGVTLSGILAQGLEAHFAKTDKDAKGKKQDAA